MKNYRNLIRVLAILFILAGSMGCASSEKETTTVAPETSVAIETTVGNESSTATEASTENKETISESQTIEETTVSEETTEVEETEDVLQALRKYYWDNFSYQTEVNDYIEGVLEIRDVSANEVYLLESHEIYYSEADLKGIDPIIIWLAKNEIYARHGRTFANEDLNNFFLSRTWYVPTTAPEDFDESCFNDCEKKNLKLLVELEANGTGSAGTGNTGSTAVTPDLVKRALNGEVIRLSGGSYSLDLDQDGKAENVSFSQEEVNYSAYYTLQVNSDSAHEEGVYIEDAIYIVSLNQKDIQILIFDAGFSDDPMTTIWNWDGDNLIRVGQLFSWVEEISVKNGKIYCRELSNLFQTIYLDMEYKMSGNSLKCIAKDLYPMGNTIIACEDIPTHAEKNSAQENGPVLKAGSEVVVVGVDNVSWVKVKDPITGEYGWLEVVEDSYTTLIIQDQEVYAWDLFEDLYLVG